MLLLCAYFLIIVLNFIFPRSKILYVVDFFFMWILMGGNHSVADYNIYLARYTNPEIFGTLEPLYVVFQNIGKYFGLDYNTFLVVMTFVFLLIRMAAILKLTNNPNTVIALYLLFPFVMDITQVRMFYSTSLVIVGLVFLLKDTKKGTVFYLMMVLLATAIHSSCILYGLLVVAKYIDKDKVQKYAKQLVALVIVTYLLLFSGILYLVVGGISSVFGFGRKFVETVYATSQAYKVTHKITYMIEIGLFFVCFNYIFGLALRRYKKHINQSNGNIIDVGDNTKLLILCYKTNYTLLLIMPLAWFTGDIYRVQHGLLILFYVLFANSTYMWSRKKGRIKLYQLAMIVFIATFIFLFLVGIPSLRETVFLPVFFDNVLIG